MPKETDGSACAACGAMSLVMHMRVAGEAGPDGLAPTTDQFGTALSDIVRCTACGHMQLERIPDEGVLDEAYGEAESTDYVAEASGQRATAARLLAAIEARTTGRRLADLGCWVGFLPAEATARGWSAAGVEPSEFASAYAREHLGADVRTGSLFDKGLLEGRFDALVMGDVIEHMPDPGAALRRASELLAPDGILALALPDAGSRLARAMGKRWWSVIPTHVQYFTRESIARLLGRHGFEIVEIGTAPKVFTVGYYLSRIGGYWPGLAAWLVATADRAGLADRLWAPDFRDRMLILAKQASA